MTIICSSWSSPRRLSGSNWTSELWAILISCKKYYALTSEEIFSLYSAIVKWHRAQDKRHPRGALCGGPEKFHRDMLSISVKWAFCRVFNFQNQAKMTKLPILQYFKVN